MMLINCLTYFLNDQTGDAWRTDFRSIGFRLHEMNELAAIYFIAELTSKYGLLHGFKGSRLPISRTMLRFVNNLRL